MKNNQILLILSPRTKQEEVLNQFKKWRGTERARKHTMNEMLFYIHLVVEEN